MTTRRNILGGLVLAAPLASARARQEGASLTLFSAREQRGYSSDSQQIVADRILSSLGKDTGASLLGFSQSETYVKGSVGDKLKYSVAITDAPYNAVSGSSVVTAVNAALSALGTSSPATLIFPKGTWIIDSHVDWSAYKNVTFRIDPGAIISHGAFTVTLPERLDFGVVINKCFVGSGKVKGRNKDEVLLSPPPKGWLTYPSISLGGVNALGANAGGTNSIAVGHNALAANTQGSSNIAIGNDTLKTVQGNNTVAVGTFSCYGWNNIGIGDGAMHDLTTGYENVCIGALTGQRMTSGFWNVYIGHYTGILGTTASSNVGIGAYALTTNFGANNIAIGFATLEVQVTGSNIAIGHTAMNANVSGTRNTAIGSEALFRNKVGNENVAVGLGTLTNLVSGVNNTAIGSYALSSARGAAMNNTGAGHHALIALTTGHGNTALGSGALNTLTTETNCTGIGLGAAVTGSNQIQLGNASTTTHTYGAVQNRSDERDKADIRDTVLGLDFIKALRPVDFKWDMREDYRSRPPDRPDVQAPVKTSPTYRADQAVYDAALVEYRVSIDGWTEASRLGNIVRDGSKKRRRYHHGLVAQEVQAVLESSGVDFGGLQQHSISGGDDVLSIGYVELIAPMIRAIQQLSAEIEALKAAS